MMLRSVSTRRSLRRSGARFITWQATGTACIERSSTNWKVRDTVTALKSFFYLFLPDCEPPHLSLLPPTHRQAGEAHGVPAEDHGVHGGESGRLHAVCRRRRTVGRLRPADEAGARVGRAAGDRGGVAPLPGTLCGCVWMCVAWDGKGASGIISKFDAHTHTHAQHHRSISSSISSTPRD